MAGGKPNGEDVHAAGERNHRIIGDTQQYQSRAA